jgi:hypothetical protein
MHALEYGDAACPYCGEPLTLALDPGAEGQTYVEDCQVCCRPILVQVSVDAQGELRVELRREDE